MKKIILALFFAVSAARAQTNFFLPLATPISIVETAATIKVMSTRPLEQCVVNYKFTNGWGRAVERGSIIFMLADSSGQELRSDLAMSSIQRDMVISPEELNTSASELNKNWRPSNPEDELLIIIYSVLKKVGAGIISPQILNSWALQCAQSVASTIK